ncbi:MFS transporter [Paenibacillus silviterrae]|uniref:MFS transporter n=1 Tax=Paenibacillus silviterrae TaxID=3242194 RepID=UPI0025432DB8|nr:MFS transporter [Paenibacillus chinjuensis]
MKFEADKYSMHLYIFVFYMGQAALYPYLGYWFSEQGLSHTQVGIIFSLGPILGLFIQPIWGMLCDRFRMERTLLMLSTLLAPLIAFGYLFAGTHFTVYAVTALGLALTASAMVPIAESLTVRHAEKHGFSYGGIRVLGSISFAVTAGSIGLLYRGTGLQAMFWVYWCLMAVLLATLFLFDKQQGGSGWKRTSLLAGLRPFLAQRRLLLFLLLIFGVSVGSAVNNVFFSIYVGAGEDAAARIGILNTISALSELPLFVFASRLIRRFHYFRLLCIVALAAGLRWFLISLDPSFAVLAVSQMLHGVTFALFVAAGIGFIHEESPPGLSVTGQTIFAAVSSNLAMLTASNVGGWLIDSYGFPVMYRTTAILCVLSAVGFLLMSGAVQTKLKRKVPEVDL